MDYTSIKTIMNRITRHRLLEDVPLETVVDYAAEFMRIVGTPNAFLEKTENNKVIQVRLIDHEKNIGAFRQSTDSFHMSNLKPPKDMAGLTYKIQGSCIITSIEKGQIEMAYRAIPIDSEGYPLIPDNSSYSRALELYIKWQCFTNLFDEGKINIQVLNNTQQQYAWAVGQAQSDMIRPTIDEMEAISAMWNKLLPESTRDHQYGYLHEGTRERIITH